MARTEGPGVLKFLPDGGDDVMLRDSLWRGGAIALLRSELGALATARNRLLQELSNLSVREAQLSKAAQSGQSARTERAAVKRRTQAVKMQLADIKAQIRKKVETVRDKECLSPGKPMFPWQWRAVSLIFLHKLLNDTGPDGECIAGTKGSTISTASLLRQLHAERYSVVERRLRSLMRSCRVAGQQGKR